MFVRCENNSESSPFSLYIARRHMFYSTCKIIFLKSILLFEQPCMCAVAVHIPEKYNNTYKNTFSTFTNVKL
jgi:hypothetical protein